MTIFSEEPQSRQMERLMTAIPNFKPRGIGVRFSESQVLITITAATPTQILTAAMRQIRCPPFLKRFNEYIESEENLIEDWDTPDMEEIEIDDDYIYRLKSPHRDLELGYYSDWIPSEDSYLGETLEEAKENLI